MGQQVFICNDIADVLTDYLNSSANDKLFILTDTHTSEKCMPIIQSVPQIKDAFQIVVEAGDTHKNIKQLAFIWEKLSENGASRNSLLINLGGGMVTDLGGFAGATFKRGINTLNIPTTLMASVDAAIGGKTGINFNGLKNEVGSFYIPDSVLIDCVFLRTLDRENLLSGYAEMIKHGLIDSPDTYHRVLAFNLDNEHTDLVSLSYLVKESVLIKERIVTEDPTEKGIRKALNLGHTIGHAYESLSFEKQRPVLHGYAIAAGLISELYLSYKLCGFPIEALRAVVNFIKYYYSRFIFDCSDYEKLYELMTHDKKNESGLINFTLLASVGDIKINQIVGKEMIYEALDFYRESFL